MPFAIGNCPVSSSAVLPVEDSKNLPGRALTPTPQLGSDSGVWLIVRAYLFGPAKEANRLAGWRLHFLPSHTQGNSFTVLPVEDPKSLLISDQHKSFPFKAANCGKLISDRYFTPHISIKHRHRYDYGLLATSVASFSQFCRHNDRPCDTGQLITEQATNVSCIVLSFALLKQNARFSTQLQTGSFSLASGDCMFGSGPVLSAPTPTIYPCSSNNAVTYHTIVVALSSSYMLALEDYMQKARGYPRASAGESMSMHSSLKHRIRGIRILHRWQGSEVFQAQTLPS